jgi:hypothetical protein
MSKKLKELTISQGDNGESKAVEQELAPNPHEAQEEVIPESTTNTDKHVVESKKLTRSEEALIIVLRKPENVGLSVKEICRRARIDEKTYYRAFEKQHFCKEVQRQCISKVYQSLMEVTARVISNAKKDEERHHWAKMVLGMGDVYDPNKKSDAKTDIKFIVNFQRPGVPTVTATAEVINTEAKEI